MPEKVIFMRYLDSMAEIKPVRAWRYHHRLDSKIGRLISPLFDVVSQEQLRLLYSYEFNSIHLSVPENRDFENGVKKILMQWKGASILARDNLPGIYVYYQYFSIKGENFERCRKGIICNVRIQDWKDNIILRHENTIPASVEDRKNILDSTKLNVSPTHGLYSDDAGIVERYMDECIQNPIYETQDYQGVREVLGVIHDFEAIDKILKIFKNKKIILADGHHRYEGSLAHRDAENKKYANSSGEEFHNYHMMYLTNTENANVIILPTHRVIHDVEGFDDQWFLGELKKYFRILEVENANDIDSIMPTEKWSFGVLLRKKGYRISLIEELLSEIYWKFPDKIKKLDLTVLHFFVFEKILRIKRDEQRDTRLISFERSLANCHKLVRSGEAQAAFVTKAVSMQQVNDVCYSGYTMPQKSTYFYPKVICGYLFNSIDQTEYDEEIDSCF